MSSKVNINFHFNYNDGSAPKTITKRAVIQHIRNYEMNDNGGVIMSPNGGHTIMCMEDLAMYVSKCNYRTDKFSRKEGLKQVFMKWLDHNQHTNHNITGIKCHQNNVIDVYLTDIYLNVSPNELF